MVVDFSAFEIFWQFKIYAAAVCFLFLTPRRVMDHPCVTGRHWSSSSLVNVKILSTFYHKILRANLACSFSEITV